MTNHIAIFYKGANWKQYKTKSRRQLVILGGAIRGRYEKDGTTKQQLEIRLDEQDKMYYRKLTPLECERLQTVPDDYTEGVSNTQRYKMLGNGFTVEIIKHILNNMEK